MARNKYPEETVKKILDVSFRLFREKGYDHTTIQDITDALGMSKGAVYHHFKSKEEILDKISDRYYDEMGWFRSVRLDPGLSGLEKVRQVLTLLLSDPDKLELDRVTVMTTLDPKLVDLTLRSSMNDAAPFLEKLLREGVEDGSITVRQPREFSQAFMILMNMWVGMFTEGREDFRAKMEFLRAFTDKMGLPILDDTLMETCLNYYEHIISLQVEAEAAKAAQTPGGLPGELVQMKQELNQELSELKDELSRLKRELTGR